MTPDSYTERVLNISTANIPKRTGEALGQCSRPLATEVDFFIACARAPLYNVISYTPWSTYGWIIWAQHELDEIKDEHPELAALMKFASEKGFTYLKLDCDANELLGWPRFEW